MDFADYCPGKAGMKEIVFLVRESTPQLLTTIELSLEGATVQKHSLRSLA